MIREDVSILLQREVRDPALGFVTVTDVEVTTDLSHAKVFVSVMGTPEERQRSLDALNRARGFLRTELGKRAHLRAVPDLVFLYDEAAEKGSRIFELLEEMKRQESDEA
jgi:ribosome-binding factor A